MNSRFYEDHPETLIWGKPKPKPHTQYGTETSGFYGHAGRPELVGGSAESFSSNPKVERARQNVKLVTPTKRRAAIQSEKDVAAMVGGKTTPEGFTVDVLTDKWALEVKTIFPGAHEKMTMHGFDHRTGYSSIGAKRNYVRENHLKGGSVMIVKETGKMYFKEGFGSYRSVGMTEVSPQELRRRIER